MQHSMPEARKEKSAVVMPVSRWLANSGTLGEERVLTACCSKGGSVGGRSQMKASIQRADNSVSHAANVPYHCRIYSQSVLTEWWKED